MVHLPCSLCRVLKTSLYPYSAGNDGWLRMWKWHNKGQQGSDASLTLTSENEAHQGHIW